MAQFISKRFRFPPTEHPKSLALSIDERVEMFFVQPESGEGEKKWFSMETYDNVQ